MPASLSSLQGLLAHLICLFSHRFVIQSGAQIALARHLLHFFVISKRLAPPVS